MVFLDGVGIGERDAEKNPFFRYPMKTFEGIFGRTPSIEEPEISEGGYHIFPSDALFGVEGLPQSGTGQTAIFCGIKAPVIINQHFGPYPHSLLHPYIKKENIFETIKGMGKRSIFVNAYPKIFFDYIKSGKTRLSVTTFSCILSGIPLKKAKELRSGRGIAADITNERWITQLKYKIEKITPERAARRLIKISEGAEFTLFEYFLTDHLGHHRNIEQLEGTLKELDAFLYTLLREFDKGESTIIICSDHGNIEDISVKTHTRHGALTITAGIRGGEMSERIKDNSEIKGEIIAAIA